MKNETLWCALRVAVLVALAAGTGALAQAPPPRFFSGQLNDYTLGSGPYEMRGTWSVTLDPRSATGDFSAAMITMKGAALTENVNGCEIQLVGPSTVTLNGGAPPFDPMFTKPSTATVCITGGVAVKYASVSLTFESGTPAASHFGSQPIHGEIRKSGPNFDRDHHDGDHHDGHY